MKVLIVDDEKGFLKLAKVYLKKMEGELEVDTTHSPKKAIEAIKNKSYDAIVSDYQMPNMDGLEFLKKVRGMGIEIPFFIFTGKGQEKVAQKALNLGADGYFKKSEDPKKGFKKLAKVLIKSNRRYHKEKDQENLIAWIEKKTVADIDSIKYDLKKLAKKVGFQITKFTKQDISPDREIIKMYTDDISSIPRDKINAVKEWKKKEDWSSEIINADAKVEKKPESD